MPCQKPTNFVCYAWYCYGDYGIRYPLPSRELIADFMESMTVGHALDGLVLITNCDKITPGMLIAAARLKGPPS